jgi:hypothetical protein
MYVRECEIEVSHAQKCSMVGNITESVKIFPNSIVQSYGSVLGLSMALIPTEMFLISMKGNPQKWSVK